jgi:prepilin-type N-terminal cleavage/methylation domain-containing protein
MTRSAERRRGMTLIEVLIAMTILSVIIIGLGGFSTNFARTVSQTGMKSTASDLVADRIETVKAGGRYDLLETQFQGTESAVTGHPGFTRKTMILRVGGAPTDSVDYKVVTVEVTAARLPKPVRKSTVISSF